MVGKSDYCLCADGKHDCDGNLKRKKMKKRKKTKIASKHPLDLDKLGQLELAANGVLAVSSRHEKPKVLFEGILECAEIERMYADTHVYAAHRHGQKNPNHKSVGKALFTRLCAAGAFCCYEPVPMFKTIRSSTLKIDDVTRSIPFLFPYPDFEKGARYLIRIERLP